MIYVFLKRFFTLDHVDMLTQEQAHELSENDIVGAVMEYENFEEFAFDFNNDCFANNRYIIKSFEP